MKVLILIITFFLVHKMSESKILIGVVVAVAALYLIDKKINYGRDVEPLKNTVISDIPSVVNQQTEEPVLVPDDVTKINNSTNVEAQPRPDIATGSGMAEPTIQGESIIDTYNPMDNSPFHTPYKSGVNPIEPYSFTVLHDATTGPVPFDYPTRDERGKTN